MSSGGGGFFNRFTPWGGGDGAGSGSHQGGGPGRGGNHPECRLQGPGEGGRRGVSFEDATEYDLAGDYYGGDQYPIHHALSDAEFEARRNSTHEQ